METTDRTFHLNQKSKMRNKWRQKRKNPKRKEDKKKTQNLM